MRTTSPPRPSLAVSRDREHHCSVTKHHRYTAMTVLDVRRRLVRWLPFSSTVATDRADRGLGPPTRPAELAGPRGL